MKNLNDLAFNFFSHNKEMNVNEKEAIRKFIQFVEPANANDIKGFIDSAKPYSLKLIVNHLQNLKGKFEFGDDKPTFVDGNKLRQINLIVLDKSDNSVYIKTIDSSIFEYTLNDLTEKENYQILYLIEKQTNC